MPRASLSIRSLLATGMVVSVLLCCCQGGSLGQKFTRLLETGSLALDGEAADCCASDGLEDRASPGDDDGPCDCRERAKAQSLPDARPTVDLAGAAPVVSVTTVWVEPIAPPVVLVAVIGS